MQSNIRHLICASCLLFTSALHGQSEKSFDIVTIKKSNTADGGMGLARSTPDQISIMHTALRNLIARSYSLREDLVLGGPSWLDSEEFDIQAKVLPDEHGSIPRMNRAETQARLQTMLRDRFQLKSHLETRNLSVYELTLADIDKLKPAKPGATYADGVKGPDGRTGPGLLIIENNHFTGQAITITALANILSDLLHRTVLDHTSQPGLYDISFQIPSEVTRPASAPASASESEEPSLSTVLQQELGLRLKSTKGEGKVLIIDHIEEPSPN